MKGDWANMWRPAALTLLLGAALSFGAVLAQPPPTNNDRPIKPQANVQDRGDVWVLDLVIKDTPRLIKVDIPGRGTKLVWYLLYHVVNRAEDGQPHNFIPDFELVTLDKPAVHHDEVMPKVQEAIRRVEDPTGKLNYKNSVTIAGEPIPATKKDGYPRKVFGVATWIDVSPDTNRFSIFVSGLSNGWSVDDKEVIRRKTLQLNFKRVGDRIASDPREFRFVPPEQWIYRASNMTLSGATPKPKESAILQPEDGLAPGGNEKASPSRPRSSITPR